MRCTWKALCAVVCLALLSSMAGADDGTGKKKSVGSSSGSSSSGSTKSSGTRTVGTVGTTGSFNRSGTRTGGTVGGSSTIRLTPSGGTSGGNMVGYGRTPTVNGGGSSRSINPTLRLNPGNGTSGGNMFGYRRDPVGNKGSGPTLPGGTNFQAPNGGQKSGGNSGGLSKGGGSNSGGQSGGNTGGTWSGDRDRNDSRSGGQSGVKTNPGGGTSGGNMFGYKRDPNGNSNSQTPQTTLRKVQSRSGTVRYGSQNNTTFTGGGWHVDRARVGRISKLDRSLWRTDGRVGIVYGGYQGWRYRSGYCHYRRDWRDDYFWYPYYIFDPFSFTNFVASPWYYYPFLPAYLNPTRVIFVNNYYGYNNYSGWDAYNYQPMGYDQRFTDDRYNNDDRYNGHDRDLDLAIDDIVSAFEHNDRRAAAHLIPRTGSVAIYLDGAYNYSLNPDDFYDLFMDAVENAKTKRYMIEDVKVSHGVAKIVARHDYTDPWDREETVWHRITLQSDRGVYEIREFETDYSGN